MEKLQKVALHKETEADNDGPTVIHRSFDCFLTL